jgi:hypothetical protein
VFLDPTRTDRVVSTWKCHSELPWYPWHTGWWVSGWACPQPHYCALLGPTRESDMIMPVTLILQWNIPQCSYSISGTKSITRHMYLEVPRWHIWKLCCWKRSRYWCCCPSLIVDFQYLLAATHDRLAALKYLLAAPHDRPAALQYLLAAPHVRLAALHYLLPALHFTSTWCSLSSGYTYLLPTLHYLLLLFNFSYITN